MRVAYLTSRYPEVSHSFILREVQALRRAGLEVETLAIRRPAAGEVLSSAAGEELARTTYLLPIGPARLLARHLRAFAAGPRAYMETLGRALRLGPASPRATLWRLFYFAEAMLLWDVCRRRGLRHVHVHFANVAADVALLATAFANAVDGPGSASWSFTMHGPTELYDVPGHRLAAKARAADFVVCISDFARSQLMGLLDEDGWDRLHVVHCGIDPDEYRPDPAPAGTPRVLCVGRLVPEKGQAVLVDAIARLRERGVPVECTLVGEGPSRPALETAIRARGLDGAVELAGAVSQDEIRAHYAAADVFCLPSFAEGVPVVLMEAMAMEIPVVTTRIAGIPELVADGVDGVLVAPGRPDELADALARLAGAPDERRRLGAAGRRAVLERYDIRAIGPALRALFERHARF